ncbi:NADH dehydrogenase [ubiquinone] 1 alpha subcomplex subunit 7-like [Adelges cooleyi]|uniref:NADH dehydrogenase [ubiquinone] 1 alpha subcomplex subunit 7-like n=1 Tax=Adelges cooleyi TaxID=133065 RepID=UPI00218043CE|nr:NADH dehydrogenase [ubiquinone] 1 alpha subcomplex subunit 7-like [Adelges cooleyi]
MANWIELIPSQFKTSAFISGLRRFLSRRNLRPNVRSVEDMSPATRPPPAIPKGPHHKLTSNSYCVREARGLVTPPIIVVDQTTPENAKISAKETAKTTAKPTGLPLPGNTHQWD